MQIFTFGQGNIFKHLKELAKIAKWLNSGCQNSILCPVDGKYHSHHDGELNCSDIQGEFFHDKPWI